MCVKGNTVFSGKEKDLPEPQKAEWLLEEGDIVPQTVGTVHTPSE